jgi:hypothetical protein
MDGIMTGSQDASLMTYREAGEPMVLTRDLAAAGFSADGWTAPVSGWYEMRPGAPPRLITGNEPGALSWGRFRGTAEVCLADGAEVYVWKGARICSHCGRIAPVEPS